MGMPVLKVLFLNFIFVFWASGINAQITRQDDASEVSKLINRLLQNYDARLRPNYGGPPVNVKVSMYIIDISSLDDKTMDFTTSFYFRQRWNDKRLSYDAPPSEITLGATTASRIWQPDTFIVNEKNAYFHDATTENVFLRILPNGDIQISKRYTLTISCLMNFRNFPMDRQACGISIESYGFTSKDVIYQWVSASGIGIQPDVTLPQFEVMGVRQKSHTVYLSSGNYSRLSCDLAFSRKIGQYLIHAYVPATAVVLLSWVSFWLNRNAVIARVALGAICMLILTALLSDINRGLPLTAYVKSIDIFLGTCFVMVMAALLEFATVNYLTKKSQSESSTMADAEKAEVKAKSLEDTPKLDAKSQGLRMTVANYIYRTNPSSIDKYSRVVFPLFFISFNLLYWIISMNQ